MPIVFILVFVLACGLIGYIICKSKKKRRSLLQHTPSEPLVGTTSPNRGPEIPGMTQVRPGLYISNDSFLSIFSKKK